MRDFFEGMRDVFVGVGQLVNFFKWDANDYYIFGVIFACLLLAFGLGFAVYVIF